MRSVMFGTLFFASFLDAVVTIDRFPVFGVVNLVLASISGVIWIASTGRT